MTDCDRHEDNAKRKKEHKNMTPLYHLLYESISHGLAHLNNLQSLVLKFKPLCIYSKVHS